MIRYAYDANGNFLSENGAGNTKEYRYDLLDSQTHILTAEGRKQENRYDGEAENSCLYDAFGNLLESREEIENRILYTGQQYDQETGQYYLRVRYYNPATSRMLSEDTYRGDGLNLYAYCSNNPVTYYDWSGHMGTP